MRLVPVIAAIALALTTLAPAAAANPQATTAGHPCGFYPETGRAWYNHCTNDNSWIWVRLDYITGADVVQCVGPGRTPLGSLSDIQNAWYDHKLC
ncbi:DUF6355 family natural product biosynthesis protein [Allokutzneria sp. NRRL B-24872]|uniref:DUF6355 family natural product biosynthesis protein n=1 Tax=Allokutzneria sp. NRRL B-24872 TaxID=1137961 RepID=UPI001177B921|nr:DUF6355 family natural product biosynthesis protein [Allokutzneria sp. NRRL B-24872]